MEVKIHYLGHACFMIECDGYRTVIDPYAEGMINGLPKLELEAESVFCSHGHGDHAYTDAVSIVEAKRPAPYSVEELDTPHDDQDGTLRGRNLVRIFRFDGLRIAHLGDLGDFPKEDVLLALKGVDCLLIPVGGFYTIDPIVASSIIEAVCPRVAIPMHYRTDATGLGVLAHLSDFTKLYPEIQECDNSFLLTEETPNQILVINYKP